MNKKLFVVSIVSFAALALLAIVGSGVVFATDNPLHGKIIALDAGHGGTELGAQYPVACADDGDVSDCLIFEKDVNLAVVLALEAKLKTAGALVALTRTDDKTISSRKERVDMAVAKCAALDVTGDGIADNKKCDALVSVHHNGNIDPTYDGTLTIYTQNSDKPLAKALYNSLLPLTNKPEGMLNGGYGMTVYKNLVSAITEAYYITNDCEAELYLYKTTISASCDKAIYPDGDRIDREAQLQIDGLSNYFTSQTGGKGRSK